MKIIRLLKRELASEALLWVQKGLISQQQAENVLHLYETKLPTHNDNARGYNILMTLGALFAGLAFIVLVSANWESIPRPIRMAALIATTAGANSMGIRAYAKQHPSAGVIWFFLGSLLYGASIMLIAQIYHLGEHFPDGIYWWILGVLPLALILKSRSLMLMAQILALIWFATESALNFMPWSFALFTGSSIYFSCYLRTSNLLFFTGVMGLNLWATAVSAWWFGYHKGVLDTGSDVFVFSSACVLATIVLGTWLEKFASRVFMQNYGALIRLWGLRAGVLVLLLFTFKEPWESLFDTHFKHPQSLFLSLSIGLGSWLLSTTIQLRHESNRRTLFATSSIGLCILFWAAALISIEFPLGNTQHWQITANILVAISGIALILEAVYEKSTTYYYMGIAVLLLMALFRYFDLVGDYMGTTVLFMVCATILFGAARFWQRVSIHAQERSA